MTRLVGRVKGKPGISFRWGISCRLKVEVPSYAGDGVETYVVVVRGKGKPWRVKEGDEVGAEGILKGNILWADSFWAY